MNNSRNLLLILLRQNSVKFYRNFHVVRALNRREVSYSDRTPDFNSSLFLTNFPNKRRERKVKKVEKFEPVGPLIIDCKNKNLNFYGGKYYGKFDLIPLASKGWYHRKATGDYFTILPTNKYSPFITKEELPTTFEGLGISKNVIEALKILDVNYPTFIQAKAFEKLLAGSNVCLAAECGSGKTLAYFVAMIENILKWKDKVPKDTKSPLGIIILPSRESITQLSEIAMTICSVVGLRCQSLMSSFVENLKTFPSGNERIDVLITSAQALKRGIIKNFISTKYTKHVVVDDAHLFETRDKFICLENILKYSNLNFSGLNHECINEKSAQICFVTAALSSALERQLNGLIRNEYEKVTTPHLHKLLFSVTQKFMRIDKRDMATMLLEQAKKAAKNEIQTLIFSNKPSTAAWISFFLKENGVECLPISKKLYPEERLNNLKRFQLGEVNLLSTTNILSSGVNFPKLKQIISYEFPLYMPDYISRCGRVGRLQQVDDCSITHFISQVPEARAVQAIEMAVRTNGALPGVHYPKSYVSGC